MQRIFYADKDTTLYEKRSDQNTGIDEIIELSKTSSGSRLNGVIQANTYNSRMLVDFGSSTITTISSSLAVGGSITANPKFYLNLHASDASDLLTSYEIKAYPVSESWTNGAGNYTDIPIIKYGASWYYRTSEDTGDYWTTGSFAANTTGSGGLQEIGGGTWWTGSGYAASQSFQNESPDVRMNVTDIVAKWVTGSGGIDNNGFIIKRPTHDEISGQVLGNLKFFSRETHTIYVPKLEVAWNDTTLPSAYTNISEISANTFVPYFKNIKREYRTSEITKFRIGVRPEFPEKLFQTSSFYLTGERLPTSSFYSIFDSVTNEVIIPFDSVATKIDGDSKGSFFKLRMDTFMPERYYKIMLKIERDGGNDIQTYDDFYFKVVN